jgi:uncharacterized repeat protein (TIGR04076 family)
MGFVRTYFICKGDRIVARCKITIVKKTYNQELVRQYSNFGPDHGPCPMFEEGQTFICGMDMPAGFCSWAWDDIHKLVFASLGHADFNTIVEGCSKDNKAVIGCCTDGYRPVVFLIEAIEED